MAHEGYHEPVEKLSAETQDFHRAYNAFVAKQRPEFKGD